MSNGNFVPYSRESIPETTWYTNRNKNITAVMFALLLDAHYKKGAWYGIPLNRGDVLFSSKKYAERLGIPEKTLSYTLKQLEKLGEIKLESKSGFNGYTKVSILKYDNYVPKLEYNKPKQKQSGENEGENGKDYSMYEEDAVMW